MTNARRLATYAAGVLGILGLARCGARTETELLANSWASSPAAVGGTDAVDAGSGGTGGRVDTGSGGAGGRVDASFDAREDAGGFAGIDRVGHGGLDASLDVADAVSDRRVRDVVSSDAPDAAPTGCTNDSDCTRPDAGAAHLCDSSTGRCVECLSPADCGGSNYDCVRGACIAYSPCQNSLDCPAGRVCDRTQKRCVDCTSNSDCSTDSKCASESCRLTCLSDLQCTPFGLLCDATAGTCVSCILNTDCAPEYLCRAGECVRSICSAGSSRCKDGTTLSTCDNEGGSVALQSCAPGQICVASDAAHASCQSRICTPLAVTCADTGNRVVECSADGLRQNVKEDCGAASKVCIAGACLPPVCAVGSYHCNGSSLLACNANGTAWIPYLTCTSSQYCDANAHACPSRVCTPSTMGCVENATAMCNAEGSAFGPILEPCAPRYCAKGICSDPLFVETFDNDIADGGVGTWSAASPYYLRAAVSPGVTGSGSALVLTNQSSEPHNYDGIYRTFSPGLQPSAVSVWIRSSASSPRVVLSQSLAADSLRPHIFVEMSGGDTICIAGLCQSFGDVPIGTWMHLRVQLDWTNRRIVWFVSAAVDGGEQAVGSGTNGVWPDVNGPLTSIRRIDLFDSGRYGTSSFDQIEFLP